MMIKSLTAVAATAAVVSSASAVTLQSFEDLAIGETAPAGGTVVNIDPGITNGTQASRFTLAAQPNNNTGNAYTKIAEANNLGSLPAGTVITDLQVDVAGSESLDQAGYLQIVAGFFFGSDNSFNQVDGSKSAGGDSFLPGGEGQYTITYSAADAAGTFAKINREFALGNFVQFGVYANRDPLSKGTLTVDNLRVNEANTDPIPEPASLALLGLSGLALLRRRRG